MRISDWSSDVCSSDLVACNLERMCVLEEVAAPWRHIVVEPLRELRQAWRSPAEQDEALRELRKTLKTLELQAERSLLERLQTASREWNDSADANPRSEEHTSELQSLMRISYAVFCLKKQTTQQ